MFCLVFINWLLFLCNCVLCFFARLRKCPRGREESFCAAASQIAPGRTIVDLPTWQCQSNKSLFLLSFCFSSFICYPLFHLFPLFKRCKICNIVFGIEHDSPRPLELFRKFISEALLVPQFLNIQIFECFFILHWIQCKGIGTLKKCSTIYEKNRLNGETSSWWVCTISPLCGKHSYFRLLREKNQRVL